MEEKDKVIELLNNKINSLTYLIESYKDSIEFNKESKDYIICHNYQTLIRATNNFVNELVDIKLQIENL